MYFPNESYNNDKKRAINFIKLLEQNPYKYHKKKIYFPPILNNSKQIDNENNNSGLLFCQNENDKILKSFHNFIKSKSQILDENRMNYLNFLEKEKERKSYKTNNTINYNKTKNIFPLKISESQSNFDNYKYTPKYLKNNGSDVTNPNYFDNIAKKLKMKKNLEFMNYNRNINKIKNNSNYHYMNSNFPLRKNIPFSPGKINNLRYYFLGESKLQRNPIVNPGNICSTPLYNNFNRKKSEFSLW